jgi:hypothetical protein
MTTLAIEVEPLATGVKVTSDSLSVELADGREVTVPLMWFPRLLSANKIQRENWRMIGGGVGIHWEDVDEDISVETLMRLK